MNMFSYSLLYISSLSVVTYFPFTKNDFLYSPNMTSLNTFFSFFNMPASEFLKRYRKYMLKLNAKEMEDEKGSVSATAICQKYFLSDVE